MEVEGIRSYETVLPSIFLVFKVQLKSDSFSPITVTVVLQGNISINALSIDPCWDWGFIMLMPCKFQGKSAWPEVFVNRQKERDVGASLE